MKNLVNNSDIPLGLGMALAKNLDAMNIFANMTKEMQQEIIDRTHFVNSKQEMQSLVSSIADGKLF